MTREEAIRQIENRWGIMDYGESEALGEALDMAIEALQREDRLLKSLETNEPLYDMVDVVRCKDCRYYECSGLPCPLDVCESLGDDGFCSCGERKGGEGEPQFYDEDDYWNGRVPTHGRLIDADALKVKLGDTNMDILTDEAKELIDSEPTIPVVDITQRDLCEDINCEDCPFMKETCKLMDCVAYADRPHGEWQDREVFNETDDDHIVDEWQSARCSVCGKYHTTPYMYYFDNFNFCPNCGADMRKENK